MADDCRTLEAIASWRIGSMMTSTTIATNDLHPSNTAAVLAHLRAMFDSSPVDRRMAGLGRATPLRAGELLLRLQPGMRAPSSSGGPSFDVAGVVAETALDAGGFAVGDRVFGVARDHHWRDDASYARASVGHVAKLRRTLAPAQSATLASSATTAWRMLFRRGRLEPGEIVTIIAARSAVGALALQLARAHDVHAIVVSPSDGNHRWRTLGAHRVADIRTGALESACRVAAVVVDTVGGLIQQRALSAMQEGGVLLSCASRPEMSRAPAGVSAELVETRVTSRDLARIAVLIDAGRVVPELDEWLP